jgi:hypothetical protein
MASKNVSRRTFVRSLVSGAALTTVAAGLKPWSVVARSFGKRAEMPTRNLRRTGHSVCLFSLGGQATLEQEGTWEKSLSAHIVIRRGSLPTKEQVFRWTAVSRR